MGAVQAPPVTTVTDDARMTIDPLKPVPRYQQLATILRKEIEAGSYPRGTRLPSEKTLVQEYGLARETVSKALDVLRDEGLAVMVPGLGWFVPEQ